MCRASARILGTCVALGALVAACHEEVPARPRDGAARVERIVEVLPRIPHLPTFPCAEQCHADRMPDPTPRALTLFHAGRTVDHGPAIRWCDRCHAVDDLDHLTLMDGRLVSFDESDRICAQCHGERHRDWEAGIHGTLTGGWRGAVQRRTCTACHDPHAPGPIRFEALPPPRREARLPGGHDAR